MLKDRSDMSVIHWARGVMADHGLIEQGWKVVINKRLSRALGRCCYSKKTIEFCEDHVKGDSFETIRDTLLHEIAHALVGPGHGHGDVWKRMAVRVGADPVACKPRVFDAEKEVTVYAVFRTYPSGKTVYVSETSKHFYNKCMKGYTDIKKCTIRNDPTSRGQLSIRQISSKELIQYKS